MNALSPLNNNGRILSEDNSIENSPKRKMWPERSVHIVSHYPVHPLPEVVDINAYTYSVVPE